MQRKSVIKLTAAAIGFAAAAASTPARADENQWRLGMVYDQHWRQVGLNYFNNWLTRWISGQEFQMAWTSELGFNTNALLLYPYPNCPAGQEYVQVGTMIGAADLINPNKPSVNSPKEAVFDGETVWAPSGPVLEMTSQSNKYEGKCSNVCWGVCDTVVAKAVNVGPSGTGLRGAALVPPFFIY